MKINSSAEFDQLIEDNIVLVDFFATWCGPCKMLTPTIEALEKDNADKFKVAKVDIDEQEELTSKYGIVQVPTMLVFKNGKVIGNIMGYHPKEEIEAYIEKVVNA
ncbi:MAG: thioredoxin [Erysipelotrichaceae bacterium]